MGLAIRLLSGAFGKWLLVGVLTLMLAQAAATAVQTLRLQAARADLAAAEASVVNVQADLRRETENRMACDASLERQSIAVRICAAAAQDKDTRATTRALAVLRTPLAVPRGTGPEAMNAWQDALLSSLP